MTNNDIKEKQKKSSFFARIKQTILKGENESESPDDLKLRDVIKGLDWKWFLRQVPLLFFIFVFGFFSITFRYAVQEKELRINALQREITDYRYRVLTRYSELTEKKRQSKIEQRLKEQGDSTLTATPDAPYLIPN